MSEPVSQTTIDLNDFTGVSSDNIITPAEASIFSRPKESFNEFASKIENNIPISTTDPLVETPVKTEPKPTDKLSDDTLSILDKITDPTQDLAEQKIEANKVKTDKSSAIEYLKEKIEAKDFVPFEDYDESKPLDEYLSGLSKKDLHALLDENIRIKEETIKAKAPVDLFQALPYELRVAADYWLNKGGRDLKGLFNALGKVEEIRELDPSNESDSEVIVSEYFRNATPDMTEDEIQGQVEEWKDLGLIEKKANLFKPKLDKMKEQMVVYQLEKQELENQRKKAAADQYLNNVYTALKLGEINGLKLDNKKRDLLYDGLTNARYQSISGANTNLLGHLLEKYQYKEPNYALISEVLWHLEDPEGFREALKVQGANKNTEETIKKLKTQQGNRQSTTVESDDQTASRPITRQSIQKPGKSIFDRS